MPPELDLFDDALKPYLPLLGAIAVDSARIEWGLSGLLTALGGQPQEHAIRLRRRELIDAIKKAAVIADGTDREPWASAAVAWAEVSDVLLRRRGDLMHSSWIVGVDKLPADDVDAGLVTEKQAAVLDPAGRPAVYSRRMRGDDPAVPLPLEGVAEFVKELHDHMRAYPAMWFAAGIVKGLWQSP